MQAPSSIFRVRTREEIIPDLDLVVLGNRDAGHVPGVDDAGEEEHWPAVLAGPVAKVHLQVGEEPEAIARCLFRGVCFGQLWEIGGKAEMVPFRG